MVEFAYQDMFPLGEDTTEYRLLTKEHVFAGMFEDAPILKIAPEGLTLLAEQAFKDVSHLMRSSHLALLAKILDDPESSDNDRYVALEMLKNAVLWSSAKRDSRSGPVFVMPKHFQKVFSMLTPKGT